jgi:hypothetical protein
MKSKKKILIVIAAAFVLMTLIALVGYLILPFFYSIDRMDLELAHSFVETAYILNNTETLDMLKANLKILRYANLNSLSSLSPMDFIYYVNICNILNIEYDKINVMNILETRYDSQDELFFMLHGRDPMDHKVRTTALFYKIMPDVLTHDKFNIENGLKGAYENYTFTTNPGIPFLNSGSSLIYCYSLFGYINEKILTQQEEWFEYWKSQYEQETLDDLSAASRYSLYYDVAVIFDESYSNEKLRHFYSSLTPEDVPDAQDFHSLNEVLRNVKIFDNISFNAGVENKIRDTAMNGLVTKYTVDPNLAMGGILLAITFLAALGKLIPLALRLYRTRKNEI